MREVDEFIIHPDSIRSFTVDSRWIQNTAYYDSTAAGFTYALELFEIVSVRER